MKESQKVNTEKLESIILELMSDELYARGNGDITEADQTMELIRNLRNCFNYKRHHPKPG